MVAPSRAAPGNEVVAELCRVLDLFALAHRERVPALDAQKAPLENLSAFDLLIYASLYAFEALVPRDFEAKTPAAPSGTEHQLAWDALTDLLAWKVAGASGSSLTLTEDGIGRSIARALSSDFTGVFTTLVDMMSPFTMTSGWPSPIRT